MLPLRLWRWRVSYCTILYTDCACDDGVHDAFRDLRSIGKQDRGVRHQVADIAHEQQAASVQHIDAVCRGQGTVGGKRPGHRFAALLECLRQVAADDA